MHLHFRVIWPLHPVLLYMLSLSQWKAYLKIFVHSTELTCPCFLITPVSVLLEELGLPDISLPVPFVFSPLTNPDTEPRSSKSFLFMPTNNHSHRHLYLEVFLFSFCYSKFPANGVHMFSHEWPHEDWRWLVKGYFLMHQNYFISSSLNLKCILAIIQNTSPSLSLKT